MTFLVDDCGFSGPEVISSGALVKLAYAKDSVGIECSLDERNEEILVYVTRLTHGRSPEDLFRRASGQRVRALLFTLLEERGITDFGYPSATCQAEQHGRALLRRELMGAVYQLRAYGKTVLDGSSELLEDEFSSARTGDELRRRRVNQARQAAQVAWGRRQWLAAAALYASFEDYLTEEERARLQHAREKSD